MFDALFFDLDGTLIDTECVAMTTGLRTFANHGHTVDMAFMHSLVGRDTPTAAQLIVQALPGADIDTITREWSAAFDTEIETVGLPLKPGTVEILSHPGLPRVIVTSSGRRGAHHKLALAGIADAFAHVVTRDDVTAPKPEPEPYLLAARLLGLSPDRCLVFEDSEPGAEAAHRAGCTVVQVPDLIPATGRWAHHVAPDLLTGARLAGLF